MTPKSTLPAPPAIRVKVLREIPVEQASFVKVRGALLDAVCLALWRRGAQGPEIVVRSQLRPPLAFRDQYDVPLPADGTGAVQWEVPAGLVELGERGESGLFARAAAEALEEVGVRI